MKNIEALEIGVYLNDIINETVEDISYAFATEPNFKDNGTEFIIMFSLQVPINKKLHILLHNQVVDIFYMALLKMIL